MDRMAFRAVARGNQFAFALKDFGVTAFSRCVLVDCALACRAEARASRAKAGGADRDRTDDLKLAKLALSQLSYGPNAKLAWLACRAVARGNRPAFALRASARQPSLASRAQAGGPGTS